MVWQTASGMILSRAELESLVQANNPNPHQLLGMHPLGDGSGLVVRVCLPEAARVEAVPTHERDQPTIKLKGNVHFEEYW